MNWPDRTPVERPHAFEYHLRSAATDAIAEAMRGPELHGPMMSLHEGFALLDEEVVELYDEIRVKEVDLSLVRKEALQVAAVALRIAAVAGREVAK